MSRLDLLSTQLPLDGFPDAVAPGSNYSAWRFNLDQEKVNSNDEVLELNELDETVGLLSVHLLRLC